MSVKAPSDDGTFATIGVDAPDFDNLDAIVLQNEQLLLYDRDEEDAWIQTADYIDLGMMI